jgi:hypothetical protein
MTTLKCTKCNSEFVKSNFIDTLKTSGTNGVSFGKRKIIPIWPFQTSVISSCPNCGENNKLLIIVDKKIKIITTIIIILLAVGLVYITLDNPKQKENKLVDDLSQKEIVIDKINPNSELERNPSRYFCIGEFCDGSGSGNQNSLTILKIPLITSGGNIGCGSKIFFAPHTVAKTTAVLDSTYKMLFDIKSEPEVKTDDIRNPLGNYTKLFYESVSIENRTAKVMLAGSMYGPGECSFSDIREQINQSAFQFNTVDKIEVYLNGKIFDWCSVSDADASESKCDKIPKYWIDKK